MVLSMGLACGEATVGIHIKDNGDSVNPKAMEYILG
jgi:hypothetical protein